MFLLVVQKLPAGIVVLAVANIKGAKLDGFVKSFL